MKLLLDIKDSVRVRSIDPALLTPEDTARELVDQPVVMGSEQDRRAMGFGQLSCQLNDFITCLGVEISGRFISQEDLGIIEESPGDGEALLFSSRKFGREAVAEG